MRRDISITAALLTTSIIVALAGRAVAGGTGENVIIIADPLNAESMYAANYYKLARHVPDANIFYFSPGATDYQAFVNFNLQTLDSLIARRKLEGQADYIVLMPGSPFYVSAPNLVSDNCVAVHRFSISSAYTTAFLRDDILGGVSSGLPNRYAKTGYNFIPFDSETAWLNGVPSNDPSARQYYLGAMLGYTGPLGNTLQEIFDNVDRSVAADFSRPAGTFYFCETNDHARSGPRENTFDNVINELATLGGVGSHEMRWLPQNRFDCLSILTGLASADIEGGNFTIIPGAYCDHLTSWAATFDNENQTKVSSWIRKGATASWGAVEEPCNYPGKFTHARSQAYYFMGSSMGESVYRAMGFTPFQGLLYGDPLCRPFDYPVTVTVDDAPTDPVAGTVALTPAGTTDKQFTLVLEYDVTVDNARVASGFILPLTFDTTALADGWHDMRVIGFDSSIVRSAGTWQGPLIVNNMGRSSTITASTTTGDHATVFAFDVASVAPGRGGVPVEIRLVSNDRILDALPGCQGTLRTTGLVLGAGTSNLQAEALYADGMRVRSAPVQVTVDYVNGTPSNTAPAVTTYTKWIGSAGNTLVEFPALLDDATDSPTFTLVDAPAQASIVTGPDGPYRLIKPNMDATGYDTMTYRVSTSSGQSALGRVILVYDRHPADINGDGVLDIEDLYAMHATPTDINFDGNADASDITALRDILRCGEAIDMTSQ